MKQILTLLTLAFCLTAMGQAPVPADVFRAAYHSKGHTLDITPYVQAYATPNDCSPAVVRALADCRQHHVRRLVFPQSVYRFRPDSLQSFMTYISNNGAYERCFAFDLTGIDGLEIDGQGSEFLFKGYVCPFYVCQASNITLRNFQIDYERTFATEGRVVATGPDQLDVHFGEDYPYYIAADSTLHTVDDEGVEYPWYYMLEFNPQRQETEWKVNDMWTGWSVKCVDLGNRTVRMTHKGLTAQVGNIVNLGIAYRKVPAITVTDSRGFSLHNVTLFHAGGMGVIAQRSRDILLDHLVITPRADKGRTVSIGADATHFVNCAGYIRMYDCHLASQTDDATNIHGVYYRIKSIEGPRRLHVELANDAQYGFDYLRGGMEVEFVDPTNLETYAHARLQDGKMVDVQNFIVDLREDIPADVKVGDAIAGCSEYPRVHIRGCYFGKNRARGLLLGSRARMLIEDCTFHNGGPAILLEGDARYWFEQSGVRDIIIRNNLFDNCFYGHWGTGIISVGSGLDAEGRKVCRYNQNIRIQGNTFRLIQEPLLDIYCTRNLTFKNNKLVLSHDYPNNIDVEHPDKLFRVRDCDNINIDYGSGLSD